jgi:hypothetical protein
MGGRSYGTPEDLIEVDQLQRQFSEEACGTGVVRIGAKTFHSAIRERRYMDLSSWVLNPKAELTITLVNLPLYWSNIAFIIYGFFTLLGIQY